MVINPDYGQEKTWHKVSAFDFIRELCVLQVVIKHYNIINLVDQ